MLKYSIYNLSDELNQLALCIVKSNNGDASVLCSKRLSNRTVSETMRAKTAHYDIYKRQDMLHGEKICYT